MLLAGRKITAQEAYERGLVTRVFPQQEFEERVGEVVRHMASLPPKVRGHLQLPCTSFNTNEASTRSIPWILQPEYEAENIV